jgi:tRNA modification GTPase
LRLDDTIAALSSAVGPAARMIIRASGPQSSILLEQLAAPGHFPPEKPTDSNPPGSGCSPRAARLALRLTALRVPVWLYQFIAPRSYTGDDLIELHVPGNPLLARLILDQLIHLGARLAEPGEFTARAYFNGRIDLSQAEGVAAVVWAGNTAQLNAARQLMAGELSHRLRPVLDQLARTLALIEAEIDFSDQDVRFLSAAEVERRLKHVQTELHSLLANSARFARLSHEPRLVLAGRPNAGKSTLLNALSRSDRAVVSPVAGTTRDALSAPVVLERGIIRLIDVAGLEESPATGQIESQMRRRALRELEAADAVILVRDATDQRPALTLPRQPDWTVRTKIDLLDPPLPQSSVLGSTTLAELSPHSSSVSSLTGTGLNTLRFALDTLAFGDRAALASELALTARHVTAIESAAACIFRAIASPAAELIAAELRLALDFLGQVLGEVSPDDILGRIFSTFCIGK